MVQALRATRIPSADEALRAPVRAHIKEALKDVRLEQKARSWMSFDAGFSRSLGAQGWIGLTLPEQYGGAARSAFARFVVLEELLSAGAPVAAHWIADRQSAPLLLRYGSETQRRRFLPGICRGEIYFCIGMSEPDAGSDLSGVRTRASRTGGGWRLNGAKIWTTNADKAHYMIALARSSGQSEDRHKGLSQFLVDLAAPGVSVRPIADLVGDSHFCEVRFDDVFLPEDALIGAEGGGWGQVVAELALERSGPERIYSSVVVLDAWIARLRGRPQNALVTATLGRLVGELAVLRGMSLAVTARLAAGASPVVEASLIKDLGTSFEQRVPTLIADLASADPPITEDASFWRMLDYANAIAPSYSLRGGTREILRGIIARDLVARGTPR